MTRVLVKNKNIFINGCPCYITHNTANKTTVRFSEVSGFDIEDFLVESITVHVCILRLSMTDSGYFRKLQNHLHIHLILSRSI